MKFKLVLLSAIILLLIPVTVSCVDKLVEVTDTYYETEYKPVQQTETYKETENVVVKTVTGKEYIRPIVKWAGYHLINSPDMELIHYYGYQITPLPHQRTKVKIALSPGALDDKGNITVYNMTGMGLTTVIPTEVYPYPGYWSPRQVDWFYAFNSKLSSARILASTLTGPYPPGTVSRYLEFDAKGVYEFAILANTFYYESVDMVSLNWEDDIVESREVTKERQVTIQVPEQVEKQRTVQKIIQVPVWELFSGN
jgi:hypothetical protein